MMHIVIQTFFYDVLLHEAYMADIIRDCRRFLYT
jgi:hypothetical protein